MTDDLNCCFHEAAHVVAAKRLGLRVEYATVRPDGPHVRTLARSDDPDIVQKRAIVDLAGSILEPLESCRVTDERNAFRRSQVIAMDMWNFDETFDGLPERAAYVQETLRDFAGKLVTDNMATIERVANALSRKITLDEAAIDALVPDAD